MQSYTYKQLKNHQFGYLMLLIVAMDILKLQYNNKTNVILLAAIIVGGIIIRIKLLHFLSHIQRVQQHYHSMSYNGCTRVTTIQCIQHSTLVLYRRVEVIFALEFKVTTMPTLVY